MPVDPNLTTPVVAGRPYYRITSRSFYTSNPADYLKVVNGQGAIRSRYGARYNHPGVLTVYLTDDLVTCCAEKMFYFQRDTLRTMDRLHISAPFLGHSFPPFIQHFVLWEIQFKTSINEVFDLSRYGSYVYAFPCMTLNPSQDYDHLKDRRAQIQSDGYKGLLTISSRAKHPGNMIVLFEDQSNNIQSIVPYVIEFRLIQLNGNPFANPAMESLNFTAGEVRTNGGGLSPSWQVVEFNH
jgi:RES domain-containing protein